MYFVFMEKQNYVYLLDDDASSRKGLTKLLMAAGYNVNAYASPNKLLDALGSDISGCILLTIGIPGMSGKELLSKLKKHGTNIPIIAISGDDDFATKQIAKDIKAVGFFRKPVDGTALLDAIEWALIDCNLGKTLIT